jgi:hypothetical protein
MSVADDQWLMEWMESGGLDMTDLEKVQARLTWVRQHTAPETAPRPPTLWDALEEG